MCPSPLGLGTPFCRRWGKDWASLCRCHSAWSTGMAVLPWPSCLLLPSHVYCLLLSPFPLLP